MVRKVGGATVIEQLRGTVCYNDVVRKVTFVEGEDESLIAIDAPPFHHVGPFQIGGAYDVLRNFYQVPDNARIDCQAIRTAIGRRPVILLINLDAIESEDGLSGPD